MLKAGDIAEPGNYTETFLKIMGSPNISSRRWIWEQYDRHVMADTVDSSQSGGDAAIVRIHGSNKAVAITTDVTPRYCEADPFEGGKQCVAETWRNLTCVGADPIAITDCLNFGNPERPEIMGQFVGCIDGMNAACHAFEYPVVSGNVSLYNETNGQAIPPTPAVGGVGLIPDLNFYTTVSGARKGSALIMIGDMDGWLGASLYLQDIEGREEGAPPPCDLDEEKRNGDFVRRLIRDRRVLAAHDCSDGGLMVAATEMALSANVGLSMTREDKSIPLHAWLFGEDQARYLLAVDPNSVNPILSTAKSKGIPATIIGTFGGDKVTVDDVISTTVAKVKMAYDAFLPNLMER